MIMNRKLFVLIGASTLVVLAIVAMYYTYTQPTRVGSGAIVAQAYPPPQSPTPSITPTETPTPTADAAGYMPTPSGITVTVTSLVGSPYADLLVPLQTALDNDDASAISAMTSNTYELFVGDSTFDGEGGSATMSGADADGYLNSFFSQGTNAHIQGYFETGDAEVPCLEVLIHRFAGAVAYPTSLPTPTGTFEAIGISPPSEFPLDAARWNFCKLPGDGWRWYEWRHGWYYPTIERLAEADTDYYLIRPATPTPTATATLALTPTPVSTTTPTPTRTNTPTPCNSPSC